MNGKKAKLIRAMAQYNVGAASYETGDAGKRIVPPNPIEAAQGLKGKVVDITGTITCTGPRARYQRLKRSVKRVMVGREPLPLLTREM